MSVLNKTLKAIEQRDNTSELGLEPTVELNKGRELPKSVLFVSVFLLACALVGVAYIFIPERQTPMPVTPLLSQQDTPSKIASSQLSQQPDSVQTNTDTAQVALTNVTVADKQLVDKSAKDNVIAEQPSSAEIPVETGAEDTLIVANNTPAIEVKPTEQDSSVSNNEQAVTDPIVAKTEPLEKPASQPQPQPQAKSDDEAMVVTALSTAERAERWFQQGQQSLSYRMVDEAITQFEQALHLAPSHKSARTMLAATLYGQQRNDEAFSVLVNGLQQHPSVLEWRVLIAKMATEQKQYPRVLAALADEYDQQAMRLADNDYWILKGTAARNLERFDIAKTSFTVLIKRQPNVAKWWLALATSEDGLGELQAAKSHYGTALQLGGLSMQSQRYARARYEQL